MYGFSSVLVYKLHIIWLLGFIWFPNTNTAYGHQIQDIGKANRISIRNISVYLGRGSFSVSPICELWILNPCDTLRVECWEWAASEWVNPRVTNWPADIRDSGSGSGSGQWSLVTVTSRSPGAGAWSPGPDGCPWCQPWCPDGWWRHVFYILIPDWQWPAPSKLWIFCDWDDSKQGQCLAEHVRVRAVWCGEGEADSWADIP